jgi:hypothetical protein
MRMFDYNYIHPGFIFIPCLNMTPDGLQAQYLIPNLMPKCECLSIHSPLPFEPRHHAIPRNQRKQSFCRTETNCRPQASLPNLLKKSSPVERDLSPNQAHKSVPLMYQFLVLARSTSCSILLIKLRTLSVVPSISDSIKEINSRRNSDLMIEPRDICPVKP